MGLREWGERQLAGRAAFTLAFFIVAVLLFVYYRILYADLLFEDRPFLSITVPAFIIALMVGWGIKRAI